jgi:hypothetical protein
MTGESMALLGAVQLSVAQPTAGMHRFVSPKLFAPLQLGIFGLTSVTTENAENALLRHQEAVLNVRS